MTINSAKYAQTLQLRHGQVLNNRIVQAPMLTSSGLAQGKPSQDTIDYYQARNQSAAMIIAEFHYVSENGGPCGTTRADRQQLAAKSPHNFAGLQALAKTIKSAGNKAILQIHHGGRHAGWLQKTGQEVLAPSAKDFPFLDYPVREMTHEEIMAIIDDFANATELAVQAGFDGVEIHGANHYLIQQFFSPYSNLREDYWGGSLEKRMNFPLQVTRAVFDRAREVAPSNFILGYRISPEEVHDGKVYYSYKESTALIQKLNAIYDFDYIHLSLPAYNQVAYQEPDVVIAREFKKILDPETVLITVGGIFNEADVEDALELADLVSVARGILLNPDFVQKLMTGNGQELNQEINPDLLDKLALTPGLKARFTDPNGGSKFPNNRSIEHLFDKYC